MTDEEVRLYNSGAPWVCPICGASLPAIAPKPGATARQLGSLRGGATTTRLRHLVSCAEKNGKASNGGGK